MEYFIGLIFVGVIVGLIVRKHKPELFEIHFESDSNDRNEPYYFMERINYIGLCANHL